jgi:hypothetical protein
MIRLFSISVKKTFPSFLQAGPSTKATRPSIFNSPAEAVIAKVINEKHRRERYMAVIVGNPQTHVKEAG